MAMDNAHPKEKEPGVIPHDPRNEPIPARKDRQDHGAGKGQPNEKEEQEVRREEDTGMDQTDTTIRAGFQSNKITRDRGTAP